MHARISSNYLLVFVELNIVLIIQILEAIKLFYIRVRTYEQSLTGGHGALTQDLCCYGSVV